VSLHDAFPVSWVIEGGILISMIERDPEGSEHRRSTSLQSSTLEFSMYLSTSSLDRPDLLPHVPSIHDHDLICLAKIWGNSHVPIFMNTKLPDSC
jgi:hypothetical protein